VAEEYVPLRHSRGGGRELSFSEEKEVDLQELISSTMLKIPQVKMLKFYPINITIIFNPQIGCFVETSLAGN